MRPGLPRIVLAAAVVAASASVWSPGIAVARAATAATTTPQAEPADPAAAPPPAERGNGDDDADAPAPSVPGTRATEPLGEPPIAAAPVVAAHAAPSTDRASGDRRWYDRVAWGAFIDAYYAVNYRPIKPNAGALRYQPYAASTGFSLAWVGLDAAVEPDPVGGVIRLLAGPSVPAVALGDAALAGGIANVQNAYVTLRPLGKEGPVTLALGKFDTIYGAERPRSQDNVNYTRGALYSLVQPTFHVGLRADLQASDAFTFKLMAVNGWDRSIDNNAGKSFGGQVVFTPTDTLGVTLGYLGGPERDEVVTCGSGYLFDSTAGECGPSAGASGSSGTFTGVNGRWRHMADLVLDARPTPALHLVANGTYVTETLGNRTTGGTHGAIWYGAALLARYALTDAYAIGARFEYLRDRDAQVTAPNTTLAVRLFTGTLTLEASVTRHLLIRLDTRVDFADQALFLNGSAATINNQISSVLGVVARTN